MRVVVVFVAVAGLLLLGACGGGKKTGEGAAALDSEGFVHVGPSVGGTANTPVAVNGFLWRASLETMSFMPLTSADAFGGVLISDWYAPPETPDERFKVNVYVVGRELRPDSLRAVVFRQTRSAAGGWADAAVDANTARGLEDTILTRARQLRAQALAP